MFEQLSLFSNICPNWEDLTIEWLLNYLQNRYPEMKFVLIEDEICQTFTKKARCNFEIYTDGDLSIWNSNKLISLNVDCLYGRYSGMGHCVDNFEDFKKDLPAYINSCKEHAKNYPKYQQSSNKLRTRWCD